MNKAVADAENIIAENGEHKTKLLQTKEIKEKDIIIYTTLFERQQLEAKYADDRTKLQPNEPCFLCGSREHPYVQSYESKISETKQYQKV